MTDELRSIFGRQADQSLDPGLVHDLVHQGIDRRRRRQQTGAVLGVSVAVTGLVIGVSSIRTGGSDRATQVGTSPSSTLTTEPTAIPSLTVPTKITVPTGPSSPTPETDVDRAYATFFGQGYDYDDAMELARLWGAPQDVNPYALKALGGQVLRDGGQLPIRHGDRSGASSDRLAQNVTEFTRDHSYAEAEHLASLWNLSTDEAKWFGGQLLRDGHSLPS